MTRCTLTIPEGMYEQLHRHLFPGDDDEHGAVIAAGMTTSSRGIRLLARELFLARDGKDYVAGQRGYRMLTAEFIRDRILYCRDHQLVYLAVHNHAGVDSVGFSGIDFRSHERGYPALLDIAAGNLVGALVFATEAVAGDIWFPQGHRMVLESASLIGRRITRLTPAPAPISSSGGTYDRQARLFGDRGQRILQGLKVGVIGAGGVGSLVVEYLARLGVGHIVIIDPDNIEETNLPRVVGATREDVAASMPKVHIAERVAMAANPDGLIEAIHGDVLEEPVARHLTDCDYLFLAADPMPVRLVFNALVHQFLISGVQMGSKVPVDPTGAVQDVYSVSRPVTPDLGCLVCNGFIPPGRLQDDALHPEERRAQRYVTDPDVIAPSVITLNALAAAQATNDFLFAVTGLVDADAPGDYIRFQPMRRTVAFEEPRTSPECLECGLRPSSRRARGDDRRLPTRYRGGTVQPREEGKR